MTPTPTPAPPPAPPPSIIGVGNVPGCLWGADPTPVLDFYRLSVHASMMRVVLPFYDSPAAAEPCFAAAKRDGFLVQLAIQWDNGWTPTQIADRFRDVLGVLGSYVWAVAIGNEQELAQGPRGDSPAQYAAGWRAVEPVVASMAPNAVRVGGEVSPWGVPWLREALADGLPGVQAIGTHPYPDAGRWPPFQASLDLAHAAGLPLWADEGLDAPSGPGTVLWTLYGALPVSQMAGATVAAAWVTP